MHPWLDSKKLIEIHKCPAEVIWLKIVFGIGDVDKDLEEEMKKECEK
jgi:hypothetical protein